jgi:integrase
MDSVSAPSSVEPKRYPCPHCNELQSSTSNRARHIRSKHPEVAAKRLPCAFCPAQLADAQQLQLHTRDCPGMTGSSPSPAPPSQPVPVAKDEPVVVVDDSTAPSSNSSSPSPSSSSDDEEPSSPCPPSALLTPLLLGPTLTSTVLTKEALAAAMKPFLDWLGESPVYEMESSLKHTLLTTESQLRQPRNDLRFLLNAAGTLSLSALVQPNMVERLLGSLVRTGKGPDRIFSLSLILRKVLVFLFVQQSKATHSVINPSLHATWQLLDRYSHEYGRKRKLRQRDRMVFGRDDEEVMTQEEMTTLMKGCLREMDRLEALPGGRFARAEAERWQKFFITLLFLTLVAPRSQTLASLSTETLLAPGAPGNDSDDQYLVRISAEANKAGQPVYLHVPKELTGRMKVMLTRVLPKDYKGSLFLLRNGKPRTDFTDITRPVTTMFLGRPINPHRFRTAVATAMYERGDVDEGLMRGLADVMTHSSEVQKAFYVRQKRLKTGAALQRIIMAGLGGEATGERERGSMTGDKKEPVTASDRDVAVVGILTNPLTS